MKHFYKNRKFQTFFLTALIVSGIFYFIQDNHQLSEKDKYRVLLANHIYNQAATNEHQFAETKEKDSPDLAWQQDFIETMDPKLGYPPVKRLKEVYKKVRQYNTLKSGIPGDGTYNWTERGPSNVSGRVRAVMFDPNDATNKKVWAGGVSGGLWYNNDITSSNSTWISVDDLWDNISIGAIAYDPSNTNVFYVGTGEDWVGSVRGDGIWKSTDGGVNWTQLSYTNDNSDFYSVQKIVVCSNGRVIAGTNKDIFISDDGGTSWTNTTNEGIFVADLEIASDGTVYAGRGNNSSSGSILKSTDNGDTWTDITPGSSQNRIELAIAPSDPNILYAVAASSGDIAWMKKSTNAGTSWTDITTPMYMDQSCSMSTSSDFARGQAWYDLILAVHPTSPDTVFVGGIDVNKSTDGGQTWKTVTYWTGACAPYSHADNHALVFRPGNDNELVTGSDGGVSYSPDAGSALDPSFTVMNNGFNITQFYACAIHPDARKNYYLAGAQDNGSHKFSKLGFDQTVEVTGGDGAFCFIDQDNPDIQITSYVYNNYYVSNDGGKSFGELLSDNNNGSFINPADYDDNMNILYTYRNNTSLYRITNVGTNPSQEILPITLVAERVTHIRVSPYTTNSSTLFLGSISGKVYKVTNADNSSYSTTDISGNNLPSGSISCIELGANEDEILVTLKNYGIVSVWYTNDGGANWTDKEGDLPDMPVRWALFNPNNRNEVILATEVGIWATANFNDAAPSWTPSNSGLANVRTDMLQMRTSDYQVAAATYGRGLYTSNGFSNINENQIGAYFSISGSANIFPGSNIQFEDLSTGNPTTWKWEFAGGTPSTSTEQNPLVTYNNSGVFDVTLIVSDGVNSDTTTRTAYINVSESNGWTEQASAFATASRGIDYISVVDKNIVWAKAYDGANTDNKIKEFTKTTDGGSTWTADTIDITGDIYPAMIHAYNADTAWIPMYPNSAGAAGGGIYITTDGGTTWTQQSTASFTGNDAFANVVYFWNKDEGFCMGDPNGGYFEIYTTTDGGSNWTRVPQANIPSPLSSEYGTVGQFCIDENGLAYFNTTKGRIFKSTDKGNTWSVITTPLNASTRIAFANEQNGIVMEAGNADNAYYTTDGGQNWTKITDGNMFGSSIQYVRGTNRMYISSSANATTGAGASYSIDGGKTWRKFEGLIDKQCLSIGFNDMTTGWIGQFNTSETQGGILKYSGSGTFADFMVSDNPETANPVTFTDNTLTIETTSTYSWNFGQDASPETADTQGPHDVTYGTGGTKIVSLIVNGDTITKELSIIATSIEEHKADYQLLVYPNPNTGVFTLRANTEKSGNLYVQIFNMNGQVVYLNRFSKNSGVSEFPIQLNNAKKGVYIMKVIDGEKFDIERLIIK